MIFLKILKNFFLASEEQMAVHTLYYTNYVDKKNMFTKFFSNSEANSSELLHNLEDIFIPYYMYVDVLHVAEI